MSQINTQIIDGKKMALQIENDLATEIATFKTKPGMAVILVGDNPASIIYVNHKKKAAEKIGINAQIFHLSPVMTQDALISFIKELNNNPEIHGIIVQLPLPKHISEDAVLDTIHPDKDIDGLHPINMGNLFIGRPNLVPCTPLACQLLLKSVCPDLVGKNAVVIGRSRLVGKPMTQLLLSEQCTVTQAHSKTVHLAEVCQNADIIISATGSAGLIQKSFVKEGAILIDVGIIRNADKKIVGDVVFEDMIGLAGAVTPVPGGVGPMTVAMLLANVVKAYKKQM
ncbi:MAG: bifunctional 5,10-methylenetetrahydrofolate dehydrogenase/5,10-methenyltetrahydrofolate cyclohydrolase [Alphaproteobacteria bacterium]|nr:bifunctional 5,10-methylenetetrahydrofolate dehydrogenase/5,10-methenyltetrahydrofolate cyclohydrolase [Alphaproteobacteria bacterium]MBR3912950.1 bifunctional 5,10-methylenetetrahydrofolate dehydrogenase/5,10-methenyltetrahydrofolate cyclohydrolase [Alphaproteobacteria bacterium]